MSLPSKSQPRVVIESITPSVDQGRFAVKRIAGDDVAVEADVFADGHDAVCARLLHRSASDPAWRSTPMTALGNDRFAAGFVVVELGLYEYTLEAWVDSIASWRRGLIVKHSAGQDVAVDLLHGAELVRATAARAVAARADESVVRRLDQWATELAAADSSIAQRVDRARSDELLELAQRYPDPEQVLRREPPLTVRVDRPRARYSSWYELFPRSTATSPWRARHARGLCREARGHRGDGLRCGLSAAHPSDRHDEPQGT